MAAGLVPQLDAAVMFSAPLRFIFMMVGRTYLWDEAALIEAEEYDPMNHVDQFFPKALLLIYGLRDDLVPIEATRDVYSRLKLFYEKDPDRLRLSIYPHMRHYLDKPAPYVGVEGNNEIIQARLEAKKWLELS